MSLDTFLSTIIVVSFLVTIVMAIGSYVAYKLRESRRPRTDAPLITGESPYFERVDLEALDEPADLAPRRG